MRPLVCLVDDTRRSTLRVEKNWCWSFRHKSADRRYFRPRDWPPSSTSTYACLPQKKYASHSSQLSLAHFYLMLTRAPSQLANENDALAVQLFALGRSIEASSMRCRSSIKLCPESKQRNCLSNVGFIKVGAGASNLN